jgi:nucleoside-diphosphate-sugar epimerase
MIHGPGNKGNLNLLYKVAGKGIPWPLGAYENRRSFTSMANLNFIVGQLLEKDIEPGTYNIADDEPLSTNRLIELIAESRGKQPRIWNIGKKWVHLAAKPGDVLPLPFNSERLKKLTESYVVSNAKLKKALGIQTLPVTAEKGMRKTLRSFDGS